MEKTAKTDYEILPLLKKRWSPRALDSKTIESAKLQRIFEAARWAPSCNNEQPWRFIIGKKGDSTFEKILSTLAEGNAAWAKNVAVLILAIAKKSNDWAIYDLGQAIAHLSIQATAEDLFIHQMAGFDPKKAAEIFILPEDCQAITASALGYAGNLDSLPDFQRKREIAERTRISQKEFLFAEKFGKAVEL